MKCLTVCQPWAWAIERGYKKWENRQKWHGHRGPLLIHAGRSEAWMEAGIRTLELMGYDVPRRLVFGAIVAKVQMTDCLPLVKVPPIERDRTGVPGFASGPFCYRFEDAQIARVLVFIRGERGFFDVDDQTVGKIQWEPCR